MTTSSYWTITYGLRDIGDPVGKHCHKHQTRRTAENCERSRAPWYGEHSLARIEDGRVVWSGYAHERSQRGRWKLNDATGEIEYVPAAAAT